MAGMTTRNEIIAHSRFTSRRNPSSRSGSLVIGQGRVLLHHQVMFLHHLSHHVLHELLVLVDPFFVLLHRHARFRFHRLHCFHGFLHHFHVLSHQLQALRSLGGLGLL